MELKTHELIQEACSNAGLSQRALAKATGISQPTISRILSGDREAKMPEVIQIAAATGHTVTQLTGSSVTSRAQFAARAVGGSQMPVMRARLTGFLELSAYLDDQAIPVGD